MYLSSLMSYGTKWYKVVFKPFFAINMMEKKTGLQKLISETKESCEHWVGIMD